MKDPTQLEENLFLNEECLMTRERMKKLQWVIGVFTNGYLVWETENQDEEGLYRLFLSSRLTGAAFIEFPNLQFV